MSENLEDDILEQLVKRSPNSLSVNSLYYIFKTIIPKNEIKSTLEKLREEGKIVSDFIVQKERLLKIDPNYTTYQLPEKTYLSISKHEYTLLGSNKVPRLLDKTPVSAEPINLITEFLAKYTEELTREIEEKYENSVKQYWVNLITVFGLFLAVFALITASSQKITIDGGKNFWDIVGLNVAQVLPLAVVLFVFIYLLNHILNNNFRSSKSQVK